MKIPAGSLAKIKGVAGDDSFPYHVKSFRTEVDLFKALAKSAWHASTAEDKKEERKKIKEFSDALGKALDDELKDFTREDFKEPDDYFDQRLGSLAMFMYLLDKMAELYKAAIKLDKVGLYALLDDVRGSAYDLLSDGFFLRPQAEVVDGYLRMEPRLVACAELTEVELVAIHEAVDLYRPKLRGRVMALIEAEEKPKSGKKPAKKKSRKR